jgi:hypothetical protein
VEYLYSLDIANLVAKHLAISLFRYADEISEHEGKCSQCGRDLKKKINQYILYFFNPRRTLHPRVLFLCSMVTASLAEIKKALRTLDENTVQELCMKLAKYKKENKELLTYLLFDAHDEQTYITSIKNQLNELFFAVNPTTVYFQKKSLRKILRLVNKQIKYSGNKQTELEIRIFFCRKMKEARLMMRSNTVLYNLYVGQLKKIESAFAKLPEDLRTDYERDLNFILL